MFSVTLSFQLSLCLSFQLPGHRQHRHHQRDEELGAFQRYYQRGHCQQGKDQRQLHIPALPPP